MTRLGRVGRGGVNERGGLPGLHPLSPDQDANGNLTTETVVPYLRTWNYGGTLWLARHVDCIKRSFYCQVGYEWVL